ELHALRFARLVGRARPGRPPAAKGLPQVRKIRREVLRLLSWLLTAARRLDRPHPALRGEVLLRLEAVLVAHLARAIDPVAEIDEGKPEAPRELDLIEDHVGAEAARGHFRVVEAVHHGHAIA